MYRCMSFGESAAVCRRLAVVDEAGSQKRPESVHDPADQISARARQHRERAERLRERP